MNIIKQSTYETCLSCCLLMLADKSQKDEIEIWKHGWKFNYLVGQLNYAVSQYNKKITAYIENKYYFNDLIKQKKAGLEFINSKINLELIDEFLKNGEVIVYLDNYYLQKILHAPHFVVATKRTKSNIEIVDPFEGKTKVISANIIEKAICSLRDYLKYSPVLITV